MNTQQQDDFQVKDKINFEPEIQLPATALTCLNGLKHGGTSRTLFICGEDPQEFYSLLNEQFETHQPSNTEDGHVVKDLVLARWYLLRRQRAYNKRESELYNEASQEDSPSLQAIKELGNYERYMIQAERAHQRATKNVATIKKAKQATEKWRDQLAIHTAKLDLQRKQFEFREQQQKAKLKGPPPASPVRYNADHECVIFQQVTVTENTDATVTVAAEPANEVVRHLIANADRNVTRPQRVMCNFTFTNGVVPPSYEWTMEGLDREEDPSDPRPADGVCRTLTFDRWLERTATE